MSNTYMARLDRLCLMRPTVQRSALSAKLLKETLQEITKLNEPTEELKTTIVKLVNWIEHNEPRISQAVHEIINKSESKQALN